MLKLLYRGKEYVLTDAKVRSVPEPYFSSPYTSYNYPLRQELELTILDSNPLYLEFKDKLCQEILQDAILYDTEIYEGCQYNAAYKMDSLILKRFTLEDQVELTLLGEVNNLQYLEQFKPIIKQLGFFDA